MNRAARALATGTTGAALAALTVWVQAAFINGETLTRGLDPLSGIPATQTTLLIHLAFPALILIPILGILALLDGPWPIKAVTILTYLAGWYWLADSLATIFAFHFGSTWRTGEPFSELFYRFPATPLLMATSLLAYLLLSTRLMR